MSAATPAAPRYFVRISPRLPVILAAAVTLLLSVHLSLQVYHYRVHRIVRLVRDFFDVDQENNLPTWYSNSVLLLTCGILLAIACAKKREKDRYARQWLGLSLVFGFLALDEDAGVHELVNTYVDAVRGGEYNSWAPIWGVLLLIFAGFFVRFWWHLPPRTRLLFAVSGIGYVAGAAVIEHYTSPMDMKTLGYNLWTAVEEGCEMYSIVLFVHALLSYMRDAGKGPIDVGVEVS